MGLKCENFGLKPIVDVCNLLDLSAWGRPFIYIYIYIYTHNIFVMLYFHYVSPSSGEAYCNRQLTPNFRLWVEIFLCADMFPCEDSKTVSCLSVRPYPEKRNHLSFVNISPTLVIDTSMERSSRVLQYGNTKFLFSFKKGRNWILTCAKKLKSFKWVSTCTYIPYRGCIVVPLRVDI